MPIRPRVLTAAVTLSLCALIAPMRSLATNTPLAETGWAPVELSPRGCIIDRATPTKLPSGEWLH